MNFFSNQMTARTIITASHGTPGAQAAEDAAIKAARHTGARLIHLYVVPDFWRGMRGDDWLNNAVTQEKFGNYLEGELAREAGRQIDRFTEKAQKNGVPITTRAMFGKPADCLVRLEEEEKPERVFIGAPRKKGETGYNSRMKLEVLVRSLTCPLTIVPR